MRYTYLNPASAENKNSLGNFLLSNAFLKNCRIAPPAGPKCGTPIVPQVLSFAMSVSETPAFHDQPVKGLLPVSRFMRLVHRVDLQTMDDIQFDLQDVEVFYRVACGSWWSVVIGCEFVAIHQ